MARSGITLTFVVAGLASGCALTSTSAPSLTGPSELGLSLSIAAMPDVLVQDGASRSRVTLTARDASNRPVRGLTVTVDVEGDDLAVDSGRLSHRMVTTDEEGEANLSYIAPRAAAGTAAVDRYGRRGSHPCRHQFRERRGAFGAHPPGATERNSVNPVAPRRAGRHRLSDPTGG